MRTRGTYSADIAQWACRERGAAVPRFPRLADIVSLLQALEKNPFGALVLLLLAGLVLGGWIAR